MKGFIEVTSIEFLGKGLKNPVDKTVLVNVEAITRIEPFDFCKNGYRINAKIELFGIDTIFVVNSYCDIKKQLEYLGSNKK